MESEQKILKMQALQRKGVGDVGRKGPWLPPWQIRHREYYDAVTRGSTGEGVSMWYEHTCHGLIVHPVWVRNGA